MKLSRFCCRYLKTSPPHLKQKLIVEWSGPCSKRGTRDEGFSLQNIGREARHYRRAELRSVCLVGSDATRITATPLDELRRDEAHIIWVWEGQVLYFAGLRCPGVILLHPDPAVAWHFHSAIKAERFIAHHPALVAKVVQNEAGIYLADARVA